jgi:hypothetical protein
MGQYEKAIPDFQAALKLNPQDSDTFSRLQWTQSQLAAKNATPVTTTTTEAAPTATPEKPSLLTQIKPLYVVIAIVVLIVIAVIVRLLTRGKAEETSHIIR